MNGLDWVLVGVAVVFSVVGIFRGLIRVVFAVLSLVVAIVVAGRFTGVGGQLLLPLVKNPALSAVVAFVAAFVVIMVFMALFGRLLSKAIHVLGLGWLDRLGGGVLGLATAALLIGVVFLVIDLAGLRGAPVVRESTLAPTGFRIAETLSRVLPEQIREAMDRERARLDDLREAVEERRDDFEDLSSTLADVSEKAREAAEALKEEE